MSSMMTNKNNLIFRLYKKLFSEYGPQGWWPLLSNSGEMIYRKNKSPLKLTENQQLEICLGAILTQNTNWKNATSALQNIATNKKLSTGALQKLSQTRLAELVKPAGCYNQKASYINNFLKLILDNGFDALGKQSTNALRDKLLSIKGIGNETADCMLLYAFNKLSFVVDAYTTRILIRMDLVTSKTNYKRIQRFFMKSISEDIEIYKEYHGLLVAHGKKYYQKKPYGIDDPLI